MVPHLSLTHKHIGITKTAAILKRHEKYYDINVVFMTSENLNQRKSNKVFGGECVTNRGNADELKQRSLRSVNITTLTVTKAPEDVRSILMR
ncbi:hypothetical protein AVEN_252775-1 [Araneus ventricosus]|uniref:Uncharacterized protein n=1 Tax=Araneus ventricosus TaxID=182803 RepID=A0A4Y2MKL0_ARAVE|nr:hypothetical protein AVEN_252775-1 [Araneus ventricosus]